MLKTIKQWLCPHNDIRPGEIPCEGGQTMKIEDQVCSLHYAKELKGLGITQESYFFYEWYSDKVYLLRSKIEMLHDIGSQHFAAFTVSELLDRLPNVIFDKHELKITKSGTGLYYAGYETNNVYCRWADQNCANALAYLFFDMMKEEHFYKKIHGETK
jgi:hypothetical protein